MPSAYDEGMTTRSIDFFTPLPRWKSRVFPRLPAIQDETTAKVFPSDSADRFTYIIMGLAVCIAILIPLLNWN